MSLNHIRRHAPLVHCISNIVVANFKANGLLAIGASPVMADAPEEVAQMVAIAGALSINMGTLNSESVKSMLAAGRAANALNKSVVFDPVGAGATEFRRHTVRELMREVKHSVLRCNVGELAAVAEVPWQQKGVDSGEGDLAIVEVAKQVAKQYHTVVAVTGETDIVTDGERVAEISGGSAMTPLSQARAVCSVRWWPQAWWAVTMFLRPLCLCCKTTNVWRKSPLNMAREWAIFKWRF